MIHHIRESLYHEVNRVFVPLTTYHLIWTWLTLITEQSFLLNIVALIPASVCVVSIVNTLLKYRTMCVSNLGFNESYYTMCTMVHLWTAGTARFISYKLTYHDQVVNIGYSGLGAICGGLVGELVTVLLGICLSCATDYTFHWGVSCSESLDHISGRMWRNLIEGVFWAGAMQMYYSQKIGIIYEGLFVTFMSVLGYGIAVITSIPIWYAFLRCKTCCGIYLPGEEKIDLESDTESNYDTFQEYPIVTIDPSSKIVRI